MSRTAAAITTLVILAAAVFGYLWWEESRNLPRANISAALPVEPVKDESVAPATAEIRYPVPADETEAPLPPLDESDATFRAALGELIGAKRFAALFRPQDIVRRIVVTVDNLPREVVADRLRPAQPASGGFRVEKADGELRIAPDNAKRYATYLAALDALSTERFRTLYVRFYPLFQSAYRDLGYPKGYFNDRLVEVIDHMLAAPEIGQPVTLVQPHVFYRYADPKLESASAGHKLMWRIGNENAVRVKARLRDIRKVVTESGAEREN